MRKKTIKFGLDNLFWYIIYLLPVIFSILIYFGAFQGDWYALWRAESGDTTELPYAYVFQQVLYMFEVSGNTIIGTSLRSIFGYFPIGENGLLPIFSQYSPIFSYIEYFVGCVLIHLVVDFLLFIPRLCHKWMNTFTQTED